MKCAECECTPLDCRDFGCSVCTKKVCCCLPLVNKGNALDDMGSYTEAIQAYDKALAVSPNDGYALVNKGNALDNSGHIAQAIQAYEKAITTNPRILVPYEFSLWRLFRDHSMPGPLQDNNKAYSYLANFSAPTIGAINLEYHLPNRLEQSTIVNVGQNNSSANGPRAFDQNLTTTENSPIAFTLRGNGTTQIPIRVSINNDPQHGNLFF